MPSSAIPAWRFVGLFFEPIDDCCLMQGVVRVLLVHPEPVDRGHVLHRDATRRRFHGLDVRPDLISRAPSVCLNLRMRDCQAFRLLALPSRTAAAFSALAIWAQTALVFPSASSSSTQPALACRRNTCCPCISTPALTTSSTFTIPCTWVCARPRPSTEELYSFVDEFVEAVQDVFPKCCIHFEDWTGVDAVHLLQRYRDKYCVYNDDVQGTAGITLAGMINATKLKGTKLKDEKYLFPRRRFRRHWPCRPAVFRARCAGHDARKTRSHGSTCSTSMDCWSRLARTLSISRSPTRTSTRRPGTSSPPSRASSRPQ